MNEKTIGYARTACHVQGDEQATEAQVEMLKAAGCSVVYTDRAESGSLGVRGCERPEPICNRATS